MTIETPVKPRSPLAAPPPDPAQRQAVPAPPPDVATRHDRACSHCGSPLHEDQLACLVCGRMAENVDGRVPWRTWGVASATTLLLVGGTVGAAIAGLPHGKHVKKPIASALAPKKAIPPATAGTTSSPGTTATTPLPGSSGATTPPALHTPKTHTAKPSHTNPTPSTSGAGGGGSPSNNSSPKTKKKAKKHKSTTPGASSLLFANGVEPGDGGLYDPFGDGSDNGGDVINTYDNHTDTAWRSGPYNNGLQKRGVGIWVNVSSTTSYKGVGLFTGKPGFDVEIYYSNDSSSTTSPSLNGWTLGGKQSNVSGRQQITLAKGARKAAYYLVWITKLAAGQKRITLSEIQLLQ